MITNKWYIWYIKLYILPNEILFFSYSKLKKYMITTTQYIDYIYPPKNINNDHLYGNNYCKDAIYFVFVNNNYIGNSKKLSIAYKICGDSDYRIFGYFPKQISCWIVRK